jgi:hypothetical protein
MPSRSSGGRGGSPGVIPFGARSRPGPGPDGDLGAQHVASMIGACHVAPLLVGLNDATGPLAGAPADADPRARPGTDPGTGCRRAEDLMARQMSWERGSLRAHHIRVRSWRFLQRLAQGPRLPSSR